MTRILLVDDHAILRKGLARILEFDFDTMDIGEAGDYAQAVAQLRQATWAVMILDISLNGRSGFEVLDFSRGEFPDMPVLILSSTPEDQLGLQAIRAGAAGYLHKETAPEQLCAALRQILSGQRYLSHALTQRLAAELARNGASGLRHEQLSPREREVSLLIAKGKTIREVADQLALSAKSVSTFHCRALDKLGLRNDAELANYVRDHHLTGT